MQKLTAVAAVIALVLVVLFSVQNLGSAEVSFLVWSLSMPKFLLVLGAYLLGMVSGWGLVELLKKNFQGS